MTHAASQHQTPEMRTCIERCQHCHDVCVEAVLYCLERGGDHAGPAHISLLLDCAAACAIAGDSMLRGSPVHGLLCAACGAVAERCADSCEELGDDQQMQACARECRRCADACRGVAAA